MVLVYNYRNKFSNVISQKTRLFDMVPESLHKNRHRITSPSTVGISPAVKLTPLCLNPTYSPH
jgi:hypothetical protein